MSGRLTCIICNKGHAEGLALFRVNPRGQPPVWACPPHLAHTDARRNPALERVVALLTVGAP